MGGATIREEEHVGIFEYLQLDRWLECGSNPRAGCCDCHSGRWDSAIQPVVSVSFASLCGYDFGYGNHLLERESTSPRTTSNDRLL